jgi:hypothetical protein
MFRVCQQCSTTSARRVVEAPDGARAPAVELPSLIPTGAGGLGAMSQGNPRILRLEDRVSGGLTSLSEDARKVTLWGPTCFAGVSRGFPNRQRRTVDKSGCSGQSLSGERSPFPSSP